MPGNFIPDSKNIEERKKNNEVENLREKKTYINELKWQYREGFSASEVALFILGFDPDNRGMLADKSTNELGWLLELKFNKEKREAYNTIVDELLIAMSAQLGPEKLQEIESMGALADYQIFTRKYLKFWFDNNKRIYPEILELSKASKSDSDFLQQDNGKEIKQVLLQAPTVPQNNKETSFNTEQIEAIDSLIEKFLKGAEWSGGELSFDSNNLICSKEMIYAELCRNDQSKVLFINKKTGDNLSIETFKTYWKNSHNLKRNINLQGYKK